MFGYLDCRVAAVFSHSSLFLEIKSSGNNNKLTIATKLTVGTSLLLENISNE